MIPDRTIQTIIQRADLIEQAEKDTNLKPAGKYLKGLCPFDDHDDRTPSFYIDPSKMIFTCFGCGKKGDVVRYIMYKENRSWIDAIYWLADYYGITIEETPRTPEDAERIARRKQQLSDLETNCIQYEDALEKHPQAMQYLQDRGISQETIRTFNLGYGCLQDPFRNRITFAVRNERGQCVGFAGRVLPGAPKDSSKYINSSETDLYQKSTLLYGLFQAKDALRHTKTGYLVEGYTDVLAMHQHGITNTVATCGTALTVEQVRLLKRFTPHITVLFDGDKAGQEATLRAIALLLEGGMLVDVVHLPGGQDPAEYLGDFSADASAAASSESSDTAGGAGTAAGASCASSAATSAIATLRKDFLTYMLEAIPEDADIPTRVQAHKKIIKAIGAMPDTHYRHEYGKVFCTQTGQNLDEIQQEVAQHAAKQNKTSSSYAKKNTAQSKTSKKHKMTADGSHYLVDYQGSFPLSFEVPIPVEWAKSWCERDKQMHQSTSSVREWLSLEGDLTCMLLMHGEVVLDCDGIRQTVREFILAAFQEADIHMEIPVLDSIVLGDSSAAGVTAEENYNYVTDIVRICSEVETGKKLWDMRMDGQARTDVDLARMLEELLKRYGGMVRKWAGLEDSTH